MLQIDPSILIQAIIFLFVLTFLNKKLFGPITAILRQREEQTEGFIEKKRALEEKALNAEAQYNQRLGEAKKKVLDFKKDVQFEASQKKAEMMEQARKEASLVMEDIKLQISKEKEATRSALSQQVESLGKEVAKKLLGKDI